MVERNYCFECYRDVLNGSGVTVDVVENPFAQCVECGDSADDAGGLLAVRKA